MLRVRGDTDDDGANSMEVETPPDPTGGSVKKRRLTSVSFVALDSTGDGDDSRRWDERFRDAGLETAIGRTLDWLGSDSGAHGSAAWAQFDDEQRALARRAAEPPPPPVLVPLLTAAEQRTALPDAMSDALQRQDHATFTRLLDEAQALGIVGGAEILRAAVVDGLGPGGERALARVQAPPRVAMRTDGLKKKAGAVNVEKRCRECGAPPLQGRRLCARHKNARSERQRQQAPPVRLCVRDACSRHRRSGSEWCARHWREERHRIRSARHAEADGDCDDDDELVAAGARPIGSDLSAAPGTEDDVVSFGSI